MIMVPVLDSRPADEAVLGEVADESGVLALVVLTFFTLPTRTTMARAGVAVFKKVDPTLNVLFLLLLFVGLGGRNPVYFS